MLGELWWIIDSFDVDCTENIRLHHARCYMWIMSTNMSTYVNGCIQWWSTLSRKARVPHPKWSENIAWNPGPEGSGGSNRGGSGIDVESDIPPGCLIVKAENDPACRKGKRDKGGKSWLDPVPEELVKPSHVLLQMVLDFFAKPFFFFPVLKLTFAGLFEAKVW